MRGKGRDSGGAAGAQHRGRGFALIPKPRPRQYAGASALIVRELGASGRVEAASPKLNLLGDALSCNLFGRSSVDDKGSGPLSLCDVDCPNGAVVGNREPNASKVGLLPGEGDTRTGVDAELDHLETVVQEELAEIGGSLPLLLGFHREVKSYEEPAHFVVIGVHGL